MIDVIQPETICPTCEHSLVCQGYGGANCLVLVRCVEDAAPWETVPRCPIVSLVAVFSRGARNSSEVVAHTCKTFSCLAAAHGSFPGVRVHDRVQGVDGNDALWAWTCEYHSGGNTESYAWRRQFGPFVLDKEEVPDASKTREP